MEYCLSGGHGLISVSADVAPREMAEVVKACRAGDREAAEAINDKVSQSVFNFQFLVLSFQALLAAPEICTSYIHNHTCNCVKIAA